MWFINQILTGGKMYGNTIATLSGFTESSLFVPAVFVALFVLPFMVVKVFKIATGGKKESEKSEKQKRTDRMPDEEENIEISLLQPTDVGMRKQPKVDGLDWQNVQCDHVWSRTWGNGGGHPWRECAGATTLIFWNNAPKQQSEERMAVSEKGGEYRETYL